MSDGRARRGAAARARDDARLLAQSRGDAARPSTDGWFRTGDVGYRDADGYLFLVDRTKDVIMRGGYSVYPREVEDALYEHPGGLRGGRRRRARRVARRGGRRARRPPRRAGLRSGGDQGVHARARGRLQVPAPRRASPTSCRARRAARSSSARSTVRRCARRSTPAARRASDSRTPRKVIDMPDDDVPVVIVGGSLVGLSTAVFLGAQGVRSLVVERHPGTAIHPRAALVSQRTVELFRALGLQGEIEAAAAAEFVQNGAIMSVESLGGKELDWYFRSINEGVESLSPAPRLFVTQIGLEPILRKHAEAAGARLEYSCEAVALEQDADGVTVHLRDRDGRRRAHGAHALRRRGRRRQEPDARAARHRHDRARHVLRQHHDLLPRRRQPAPRRSQPQRDLRLPPAADGLLPLLAGG